MKNILKGIVALGMALVIGGTSVYSYDQEFPSVKLRHGSSYFFTDTINNNNNHQVGVIDFGWEFIEGLDFNGGQNPTFSYNQDFVDDGYIVAPNTSRELVRSSPLYNVSRHPVERRSNNLEIVYSIEYSERLNGSWVYQGIHTEYQPYEITWCGDGIVDNYMDQYTGVQVREFCDPNDPSQTGWGVGGCSNICEPVTVNTNPSCIVLEANTASESAPSTYNFNCEGENADTFRIEVLNGANVISTINGPLGVYTFNTPGDYSARCFVNETITSNTCSADITVTPAARIYDLALRKTVVGAQAGYDVGDDVTFNIRIENQGDIDTNSFTITDYIPAGLTLNDSDWTQVGNRAVRTINQNISENGTHDVTIRFTVNSRDNLTIRNFAEISSDDGDDCDSTPDQENETGAGETIGEGLIDDRLGNGCEPGGDEDDHDVAVITLNPQVYDLALRKTLSATTQGTFVNGDRVVFDILIENQGNVDASQITITDYIPAGLDFVAGSQINRGWTSNGTIATRNVFEIEAGETERVSIEFEVNRTSTGTIRNFAEISADDGNDCDSFPDQNNGNRTGETLGGDLVDDRLGNGCETDGDEDDHDVAAIQIGDEPEIYDLALIKTTTGSGIVSRGSTVAFTITVENQGNVPSGAVQITDYIPTGLTLTDTAWNQNGNIATRTIPSIPAGVTRDYGISFTVNNDAPSSIRNFAEISVDQGDDCDSFPDQENETGAGETLGGDLVDDRLGNGCETDGDEDDHDVAAITIIDNNDPVYDLALRKTLVTTGTINRGDEVTFRITVENQGDLDSGRIQITDYIPTGLTLNDGNWNQSGTLATRTISNIPAGETRSNITITFTVNGDAPDSIRNFAEISVDQGDDCDSFPDQSNGNRAGETLGGDLVDDRLGNGCETDGDEDDHDVAAITVTDGPFNPSVYLIKSLAEGQPTNVSIGDVVDYVITVFNTGSVVAEDQKIQDKYFEASDGGLALVPSNDWDDEDGVATFTRLVDIPANGSVPVNISFTITDSAEGSVRNLAVVCNESEEDCDTEEPICDPATDPDGCCDDEDEVGNPEGCVVVVIGEPSILIDKTDANPNLDQDNTVGNDIQKLNEGDEAIFKIRVTNNGPESLDSIVLTDIQAPNCSGNVTLPGTYPNTWSNFTTGGTGNKTDEILEPGEYFEYTCTKPNTQGDYRNVAKVDATGVTSEIDVESSDESDVDVPSDTTSGSTFKCTDVIFGTASNAVPNGVTRCYGNRKVEAFYVQNCTSDADNNFLNSGIKEYSTDINNRRYADFNCTNANAQCKAYDDYTPTLTIAGRSWRGGDECKLGITPVCGNGVVEIGEQCDISAAPYGDWGDCGKPGTARACKLPDGNNPGDDTTILTFPKDGEIIFGPQGTKVVGHGVNPLEEFGEKPYMYNNSEYDLSYEELCVIRVSDTSITGGDIRSNTTYCLNLESRNRMIYAYERIEFPDFRNFNTDKDGIPTGADYGEGTFITTLYDEGIMYDNAYFAGELEVRVAKPSIVTTGGGTSYVKDEKITGDLQKVTDGISGLDNNTNFVGVSASDSGISSDVESIDNTNAGATDNVESSNETLDSVESVITVTTPTGTFTNYNGLENVKIVSGSYMLTPSDIADIAASSQPTTYIVDGGNLTINSNISSNKNVAFVVKGGDIKIANNVNELDGTYIAIKTGGTGGAIKATNNSGTNTQLVVNGPLYGNIENLVKNRYYINETAGKLSVGTIVSFGSRLLTKPAPLVSQFVAEYLTSDKAVK